MPGGWKRRSPIYVATSSSRNESDNSQRDNWSWLARAAAVAAVAAAERVIARRFFRPRRDDESSDERGRRYAELYLRPPREGDGDKRNALRASQVKRAAQGQVAKRIVKTTICKSL